jgi:O-antigen/teichoic acid export membrane protein
MTWNVLTSWGGHFVFIVAGFILPRIIDRQIGQVSLGVWDFSWSLVNYFSLAGIGIGSSVNRHVAMCRAENNLEEMNRTVSSVQFVQLIIAVVVLLLTAGAVFSMPWLFAKRLGSEIGAAVWVVGLLGASLAVQMAFDTSRGVITGCHRWDLHNGINSGSHAFAVMGMIIALHLGGGLVSLGLIHFFITIATEISRVAISRRVCPELKTRVDYVGWEHARRMLVFGGKSVIAGFPSMIVLQGSSLLVAGHLGPAALAIFSRPGGLLRNAQTFVGKYAYVLTPTAGSLQGKDQFDELRNLVIKSTRFCVFLTLPIITFLAIMGDPILRIWMGPRYEQGILLAIFAIGYFLPMTQMPVLSIMVGMNLHGRVGFASLVVTLVTFGLGAIFLHSYGWTLERGALLSIIPLSLGNGIVILIYACRHLNISITEYLSGSFLVPLACAVPFTVSLVVCRVLFNDRPLVALGWGVAAMILIIGPLYIRYVLPNPIWGKVKNYLRPANE